MKQEDLIKICENCFNNWFTKIRNLHIKGIVRASGNLYCATEVQTFESPDHFIIELAGSQPIISFKKIKAFKKTIKVKDSTNHLIGGLEIKDLNKKKALLSIEKCRKMHYIQCDFFSGVNSFFYNDLGLRNKDKDVFEIPFFIDSESNYILMDNCKMSYHFNDLKYFYRMISFALFIKKNTKKEALARFLISTFDNQLKCKDPMFMGVFIDTKPNLRFRQELLSLANQQVHETRIDAFINQHNTLFAKTLNYKSARSNIELKILDKKGWDKNSLIPDYLMEREDGSYDILDLKKGLTKYSLTKGGKSRRRLNSYCYELVAQLEGYKRYFESPLNSQWALDNFGIRMNHSPRLIGIVGNQNSFFREEIDEALLVHRDNIVLFSYNDICDLLSTKNKNS